MNKWNYKEISMTEHPRSRVNGCVLEHILIAEKMLGRYLKTEEVVHHIEGDPSNNSQDNLIIFATSSDHSRFHQTHHMVRLPNGIYVSPPTPTNPCLVCGKPCANQYCSNKCLGVAQRKVKRPNRQELTELIQTHSLVALGKRFGVSDNAVRKWAKSYGIPYRK